MLSLLLSLVAAVVAGAVMFRTTLVLTGPQVLATTTDLARALPIPLIGQTPLTHKPRPARPGRWITPSRVRLLTRCAEIWLVALLVLSAVAVCLDHTLAGQLAADPLGVLSEIVGRFTGH